MFLLNIVHNDLIHCLHVECNNYMSFGKDVVMIITKVGYMACFEKVSILAEDHRSRTCPGTLASPTGFEVQPPHRR